MVKQWNIVSGIAEQCWWNSGTVMVEQCGATVERCWWNSGTVLVEQWNSDRGTVSWVSGTVMVEQCGGTVEQC